MRRSGAIAAAAALVLTACEHAETAPDAGGLAGEGVTLPDGTVFTRRALLEATGACVLDNARTFEQHARALDEAAARAAADPSARAEVRTAWQNAIDQWQKLELLQIGPAASSTQPGGADLRDNIYAWPLTSPCAVDGHLVAESYAGAPEDILINARGLGAAEYLLFYDAAESSCDPTSPIVAGGAWAALDASGRDARRAAYAAFVAKDLVARSGALVAAWDPAFEDFAGELARAGDGSRIFTRQRIALNAVSDALFYIEWATKDLKVGRPAGVTQCDAAICPETVESPFAGRSKRHVRNNLLGLRMIFTGCGEDARGLGFDDFLYAVGQGDLGTSIDNYIVAAIAAIDSIEEEDLAVAVAADHPSVLGAHQALKKITNALRTDFVTILDLELPKRVEGDND